MKKIVYIPTLNIGVCYWRIEAYANEMVRQKVPVFVNYFYNPNDKISWEYAAIGYGKESQTIQDVLEGMFKYYDILIFQKLQTKNGIFLLNEMKKKYPNKLVVAEIDDSIGDYSPTLYEKTKDQANWAAEHVRMSDAVICSTQYLADSIQELNTKTYVAPNCIDSHSWLFQPVKKTNKNFNVVYVGGAGHDEDLRFIYEPMLLFLKENSNAIFKIRYGGYRPSFLEEHPQIDFKQVSWAMSEYPQKLADLEADLALAPLRDTEFNRCKTNLKYIEWASIGVPILASHVEPYKKTKEFVHGLFLTQNSKEKWYFSLQDAHHDIISKAINNDKIASSSLDCYNLENETKKLVSFLNSL